MTMMKIGEKIRAFRKSKKMTQAEFGALVHLDSSYISRLELGKVQNPTKETLEYLACAMGITINELIGESPNILSGQDGRLILQNDPDYERHLIYKDWYHEDLSPQQRISLDTILRMFVRDTAPHLEHLLF